MKKIIDEYGLSVLYVLIGAGVLGAIAGFINQFISISFPTL